jgi:hypothetical protein
MRNPREGSGDDYSQTIPRLQDKMGTSGTVNDWADPKEGITSNHASVV